MKKSYNRIAKGLIAIFGILIMFFSISLNKIDNLNDIDLNALTKINSAEAECVAWDPYIPGGLPGYCTVAEVCIYGGGSCTFGR
jgi:hypothetical protein